MNKKQIVIGLGGVATVGKDTFFSLLQKNNPDLLISRYAFADNLKKELEVLVQNHFGLNIWKLSPEDKKLIRPLMVWWGCTKRHYNPRYWVDSVELSMSLDTVSDVKVVTDVRFENEADWIHKLGGKVVHIRRLIPSGADFIPPANAEEEHNDPLVFQKADFNVEWPTVLPEKRLDSLWPYLLSIVAYLKTELKNE